MIDRLILEKFLRNECNEQEAEMVIELFRKDPSLFDDLLSEDEWLAYDSDTLLKKEVTANLLSRIRKTVIRKGAGRRSAFVYLSAAAMIAALLVGGWYYLSIHKNAGSEVSKELAKFESKSIFHKENVSGKTIRFVLPDGTGVALFPHSEITCSQDFNTKDRKLSMQGKALFDVAKNADKTFVVQSGDLVTTVLGTSFTVNAFANEHTISIALHNGKILVKQVASIHSTWKENFYLKPGDELVYNKETSVASLKSATPKPLATGTRQKPEHKYSVPEWFAFNNQPLTDVFRQLQDYYGVEIDYVKEDVRNIYFIGKFDRSDSLSLILENIALLNHLSVVNKNDKYIIRRK